MQALANALTGVAPETFYTRRGSQFASRAFTGILEARGVMISWDGLGRGCDNMYVASCWRTLKYEDIHLKEYAAVRGAVEHQQLLPILQIRASTLGCSVQDSAPDVRRHLY